MERRLITWKLELNDDRMTVAFDVHGERVAFKFSAHERLLWASSFSINLSARLAAEVVEQVLAERLLGWLRPWNAWRLKFVKAAINREAMGNLGYEGEELEAESGRRDPCDG
jgi:hypothetical protein